MDNLYKHSDHDIISNRDAIASVLSQPKRGDIIAFGDHEYRYTAMGERWQRQDTHAHWAKIDYLEGDMFTTAQIRDILTKIDSADRVVEFSQAFSNSLVHSYRITLRGDDTYTVEVQNGDTWQEATEGFGIPSGQARASYDSRIALEVKKLKSQREEHQENSLKRKTKDTSSSVLKNHSDFLLDEIKKARGLIASSLNGTGTSLSSADQKGIENTIDIMLTERNKLIEGKVNQEEPVSYPMIPYKNPEMSQEGQPPFYPMIPLTESLPAKLSDGLNLPMKNPETVSETGGNTNRDILPPEGKTSLILDFPTSRSVVANISEVQVNLEDIARSRAEERLRVEQKNLGFFRRAGRFFTRNKLFQKYYDEELQKLQDGGIFDSTTQHIRENAADRYAKSNTLFGNDAIENQGDTIENDQINTLARAYVNGEITREQFQEEFKQILNMDDMIERLRDITQQGTNILKSLDTEKNFYVFLRDLPEKKDEIRARLAIYLSDPLTRKFFQSVIGKHYPEDQEMIIDILSSREAKSILMSQELHVRIGILRGGEAAYAIDVTDKTNNRAYALGKWLQKHPILSGLATGLGITASSLAAGPLGNFIFGSTAVGAINGLRRNAEYTDEHRGFERRVTQGNHLQAEIYQTIEKLKKEQALASGKDVEKIQSRIDRALKKLEQYQRQGVQIEVALYQTIEKLKKEQALASGKDVEKIQSRIDGALKKLEQYQQKQGVQQNSEGRKGTTHRHFLSTSGLNRRMQSYLSEKEGFELTGEKAGKNRLYFQQWILQGLARLDTWKKTGHNFLKSRDADSMEADYNILYENILLSSSKLGISLEELRKDQNYKNIVANLEADYTRADDAFRQTRRGTSLKRGLIHGAIYGGSSLVFQWLAGSGLFDTKNFIPGTMTTTPGGVTVDPAISQQLQSALGNTKYQQFVDHLSQSTTPDTLWDTLTHDIFQNRSIGNNVKNQIMTFILNATDIQNGISKPELLIEAANKGLFSDIANNSSRIDTMFSLLQKWGYSDVNRTWLLDTLKGLDSGTVQVGSLSPSEQTKVAEALWCYVHRDGVANGSPLWQVFIDKLPDVINTTPGQATVEKGAQWLRFLAIPTWRNTFLSALSRKPKETRSVEEIFPKDSKDIPTVSPLPEKNATPNLTPVPPSENMTPVADSKSDRIKSNIDSKWTQINPDTTYGLNDVSNAQDILRRLMSKYKEALQGVSSSWENSENAIFLTTLNKALRSKNESLKEIAIQRIFAIARSEEIENIPNPIVLEVV